MPRIVPGQALQVCFNALIDYELEAIAQECNENEVYIALSGAGLIPSALVPKFRVQLKIVDRFGVHRGEVTILRVVPDSVKIVVAPPQKYITEQNREYFRIEYSVPLQITSGCGTYSKPIETISDDISAGGVLFSTYLELDENDEFDVAFDLALPGQRPNSFRFKARVIRVRKVSPERRLVAAQFLNVSERQREHMVKWVFEVQGTLPKPR